ALRRFRPALTVGLHGGSTAAMLARASCARWRATFAGLRHGWAYNVFTPAKSPPLGRMRLHTVEHAASLFEVIGMPERALGSLRVYPQPHTVAGMARRRTARGITGPYAFLNVEAREPGMRWPRERFAELAAWLQRERGLASVTASAGAGEPIAGVALFASTRVEELIALEADATLVVGNDGGPIHIAAALGKPIVGLYSTTDLEIWSPWQARARVLQAGILADLSTTDIQQAIDDLMD
ncbi:MAG: glycosyltransferase family 9 protein, partial [Terriglobales bacterium]